MKKVWRKVYDSETIYQIMGDILQKLGGDNFFSDEEFEGSVTVTIEYEDNSKGEVAPEIRFLVNAGYFGVGEKTKVETLDGENIYFFDPMRNWCYLPLDDEGKSFEFTNWGEFLEYLNKTVDDIGEKNAGRESEKDTSE